MERYSEYNEEEFFLLLICTLTVAVLLMLFFLLISYVFSLCLRVLFICVFFYVSVLYGLLFHYVNNNELSLICRANNWPLCCQSKTLISEN
jgi:uncharacterized membrane protein